ncbi:putative spermidine/putrescine transport system substrate-binding protein [Rhodoligotrophos appendicifer]|uniref:ABC transporter substrate-binding protein n=1 Tax=Rhodoligotrophos appendicifer TaxID=987056 RepID=UPI0011854AC5|nr:ABC transporter substrate-binding protein [Rhodoligotrophos appendicifer]
MKDAQNYFHDAWTLAAERVKTGGVDRRTFLQLSALLGSAALVGRSDDALAQAKELVFAMWGGDAEQAYQTAWGEPFKAKTGIDVVMDGSGPTSGRVRAMVEAGNVTWDIIDGGVGTQAALGAAKAAQEIDYTIVDPKKTLPGTDYRWGATVFVYGNVLTFDTQAFGGKTPKSWVDFWDVEQFPGKRVMYKYMAGTLEAALMADGVPMDQLYPLDVDRALKKLEVLKPHLILWDTGASSQQVFRDGEVVMGQIWHTRANLIKKESGGRFDFTFNQGLLQPGVMSVPVNNPAGTKVAMDFLASMQDPKSQVKLLELLGNGPANPAAEGTYPPELAAINPGAPENRKLMVLQNAEWYGANIVPVTKRFLDLMSS